MLSIGLLLAIFLGPPSRAEETTNPPPSSEPAPSEAPPTPQAEQPPAPAKKNPKAEQVVPSQTQEKPKTEESQPLTQPAPAPSAPPTAPPTPLPPATPSAPSEKEQKKEKEAVPQEHQAPSAETPPAPAPQQPAPAQQPPGPQGGEKSEAHQEAEKAIAQPEETKPPVKATEVELGGLLLKKGKLQLDFNFAYSHSSNNTLFINGFSILPILVVGQVNVETVRRDFITTTFTGRYGLMNDIQLEVAIPFQFTFSDISTAQGIGGTGPATTSVETNSKTADLGDVGTTLYYQVLKERASQPSVLFGLSWKSKSGRDTFQTNDPTNDPPSGTGFTSLKGIVTSIKTTDPAILFGSMSYAYAFPRRNVVLHSLTQAPQLIDFDPGGNFTYGMGMAYALNYRLTLSFQFVDSITFASFITRTDPSSGLKARSVVPNTFVNAGFLRIGITWLVNATQIVDISITQGLTRDAPDFTLALDIPISF